MCASIRPRHSYRPHFWAVSVLDSGLKLYDKKGTLKENHQTGDSLKHDILVNFKYQLEQCLGLIQNNQASLNDLTKLTRQLQDKETLEYKILSTAQDRTTDTLKKLLGDNIVQTSSQKALVRMCQDAFVMGKKIVSQNQDTQNLSTQQSSRSF